MCKGYLFDTYCDRQSPIIHVHVSNFLNVYSPDLRRTQSRRGIASLLQLHQTGGEQRSRRKEGRKGGRKEGGGMRAGEGREGVVEQYVLV